MNPRLATATLLAPLLLGLSACGVGREAQTYQERTVADATNVNLGPLAIRNIAVQAPEGGASHELGGDASAVLTVTSADDQPDTLLGVTSSAATSVEVLVDGAPGRAVVPARGTTRNSVTLALTGLTAPLRPGEFVPMQLRFERNGTVEVQVPVKLTGESDREVLTGEPGSAEGEPALGGPAGGHGGKEPGTGEGGTGTAPLESEPATEPAGAVPSTEPTPLG